MTHKWHCNAVRHTLATRERHHFERPRADSGRRVNGNSPSVERSQIELANLVHRHEQMPRVIHQRPKTKPQIELPGGLVNRLDLDRPNADLLGDGRRTPQGIHQKQ